MAGLIVNTKRFAWGQLVWTMDTTEIKGFRSISFQDGVEEEQTRGAGIDYDGNTVGQYMTEPVEVEYFVQEGMDLVDRLGDGYFFQEFPGVLTYGLPGVAVRKVEFVDLRIINISDNYQQSVEGLVQSATLRVRRILRNGKDPIGSILNPT